jgi:gliding motility-associated-like protein
MPHDQLRAFSITLPRHIAGIDLFPRNDVWVYDRSGNAVFHQKGYDNQWAGTWNGKLLPDSVYYYVVDPGDGSKLLTGNLTINR